MKNFILRKQKIRVKQNRIAEQRHFLVLIILACSVLLTGCNDTIEKEHTEDIGQQVSVSQITEDETTEMAGPEPTAEQENYDIWETEHVLEIGFGYNECVTSEDIIHIGRLIHLKRLKISVGDGEIDLSPLSNLAELESLDIDIQCDCSPDLSFIANLSQLENLDITVGSEVDLSPLGGLNQLRKISIDTWTGDAIDLSFLRKLNCLEEVTVTRCCAIENLSLFQDMPYLKRLYVAYVDDGDLSYLAGLNNLEILAVIGENIRNPEGLSNLTHLKSLSLCDNSSDAMYDDTARVPFDMQPFVKLIELEWLDLTYICIEDISPLAELKSLRHIGLVKTDVGDILPLKSLENLAELYVFGNRSELVKEQAETLFNEMEYISVTEEIPDGFYN